MIKSIIILGLVIVLAAGAFLSRPSQADFTNYYKTTVNPSTSKDSSFKDVLNHLEHDYSADSYLKSIVFHDKLLYVTVEKDGQTQYIGAFSHWFRQNGPAPAAVPAK